MSAGLCHCGAPLRGPVCQRGHRLLREDWAKFDANRHRDGFDPELAKAFSPEASVKLVNRERRRGEEPSLIELRRAALNLSQFAPGMSFRSVKPGSQHSEAYEVLRHGKPSGEHLLRQKDTGEYQWSSAGVFKAAQRSEALREGTNRLREDWAAFDAARKQGYFDSKLVKSGPLPNTTKDSPGRGPTGELRNFHAMGAKKLIATMKALTIHGEDPEAQKAATEAAAEKLGVKIAADGTIIMPEHHALAMVECECGAPARGRVCQRGHRLDLREDWAKFDEVRKVHGLPASGARVAAEHLRARAALESDPYAKSRFMEASDALHRAGWGLNPSNAPHGKVSVSLRGATARLASEGLLSRMPGGEHFDGDETAGMPAVRDVMGRLNQAGWKHLQETWSEAARIAALRKRNAHAHVVQDMPDALGSMIKAGHVAWAKAPGGKRYEFNHAGHQLRVVKQNTAAGGPRWKAYHRAPTGVERIVGKGDDFKAVRGQAERHFQSLGLREDWSVFDKLRKSGLAQRAGAIRRELPEQTIDYMGLSGPSVDLSRIAGLIGKPHLPRGLASPGVSPDTPVAERPIESLEGPVRDRLKSLSDGETHFHMVPEGSIRVTRQGRHFTVEGAGQHVDPDMRRGARTVKGIRDASREVAERIHHSHVADLAHTRDSVSRVARAAPGEAVKITSVDGKHAVVRPLRSGKIRSRLPDGTTTDHATPQEAVDHVKTSLRQKGERFLAGGVERLASTTLGQKAEIVARDPAAGQIASWTNEQLKPMQGGEDVVKDMMHELMNKAGIGGDAKEWGGEELLKKAGEKSAEHSDSLHHLANVLHGHAHLLSSHAVALHHVASAIAPHLHAVTQVMQARVQEAFTLAEAADGGMATVRARARARKLDEQLDCWYAYLAKVGYSSHGGSPVGVAGSPSEAGGEVPPHPAPSPA